MQKVLLPPMSVAITITRTYSNYLQMDGQAELACGWLPAAVATCYLVWPIFWKSLKVTAIR